MKKIFTLFVAIFALCSISFAQSNKANFKKYEYGKSLLNNEQYLQAMEVFRSLASVQTENPYLEHALYFFGYSAYQSGKNDVAKNALLELAFKHPQWDKIQDAYYVLALIEFKEENFIQGYEHLKKITDPKFADDVENLINNGLANQPVSTLGNLYMNYPSDKLAKITWDALQKVEVYPNHKEIYELLQEELGLADSSGMATEIKSIKREVYSVAVVLPFFEKETNVESFDRKNQAVLDIYQGIAVAQEKLAEENIQIELLAFDTEKDSLKTIDLLTDPGFRNVDMFIGPLYGNTIPVVADYAGTFGKVMINPVSSNEKIITGNPYAFLTSSTKATQARRAADYAFDSLASQEVYIISGLSATDAAMADVYARHFESKGGKVVLKQYFDYSKEGFEMMLKDFEPLAEDSLPHVFVSSSDPVVAVNTVSALQNLQANINIIAPSEWLDFRQLTYKQMERNKVHFIYPRYVDSSKPLTKDFERRYVNKNNLIPSAYAYMGYETMYFFGKMLHKYGTGFYADLHTQKFVPGHILTGFDYEGGNDNQFVTILKFEEGLLKIVNYPQPTEEEESPNE
ncbi:ABC transporter substrate-binding protein [Flammeovirgaceae bacterium SG7u.111]|nr:ABC transporter substrate-binding protein [Flammeovirgaceae bacterium SG7u.132]WPO34772.1 ABC transporter substrate-binding protein [Flammeovirgaceae bacterium SG7u.111]